MERKRTWKDLDAESVAMQAIERAREYLERVHGMPRESVAVFQAKSARNHGMCTFWRSSRDIAVWINSASINSDYMEVVAPLVAHEFAHALQYYKTGYSDHGYMWRLYAREIAEAIGGDPVIASRRLEDREEVKARIKPETLYKVECKATGWVSVKTYTRRNDATRYANAHFWNAGGGIRYSLSVVMVNKEGARI